MNLRADRKLRGAASPAIRTNSSHQAISGCVDLQTDLCGAATARPPFEFEPEDEPDPQLATRASVSEPAMSARMDGPVREASAFDRPAARQ